MKSLPSTKVLSVQGLNISFVHRGQRHQAVHNVSLEIERAQIHGLVGESGSGKSVTSLAILGLIDPPGQLEAEGIFFLGEDISRFSPRKMRRIRGDRISMVFQEPMSSLNPVFTVGSQIAEVFRVHRRCSRRDAAAEAVRMLELVQIPSPAERARDYPHQLSGGMRQRVMIAMALACGPDLLIADEPTTALDVTIQAQILRLMLHLRDNFGMAVLLITHDMGVVAEICDRVSVMYGGCIVESGSVGDIFDRANHPYTQGLLTSVPRLGQRSSPLSSIPGQVPSLAQMPSGCRFRNRCPHAVAQCSDLPPLIAAQEGHFSRCWITNPPPAAVVRDCLVRSDAYVSR